MNSCCWTGQPSIDAAILTSRTRVGMLAILPGTKSHVPSTSKYHQEEQSLERTDKPKNLKGRPWSFASKHHRQSPIIEKKCFAILHHHKSYLDEESFVAFFDEHGRYVGYYLFHCAQYYEDYISQRTLWRAEGRTRRGFYHGTCDMEICLAFLA